MSVPLMSRPLVSIGMPVFNVETTLLDAVESIRLQTLHDWELIVVDDGSTDSTPELLAGLRDSRIRVISHKDNAGLGQRLNETVALARGKYFARMDGDDVSYPDRLLTQLEYLETHPEVDLVGAWMVLLDKDRRPLGTWQPPEEHERITGRAYHSILMGHPAFFGRHAWFVRNPYSGDFLRAEDQILLMDTAERSRFANVQRVLIGYSYPSNDIRSALRRRTAFCFNAARYFSRRGRFGSLLLNLVTQSAVAALECVSEITGLRHRMLVHRVTSLRSDHAAEWKETWAAVSAARPDAMEERTAACQTAAVAR